MTDTGLGQKYTETVQEIFQLAFRSLSSILFREMSVMIMLMMKMTMTTIKTVLMVTNGGYQETIKNFQF